MRFPCSIINENLTEVLEKLLTPINIKHFEILILRKPYSCVICQQDNTVTPHVAFTEA
jgi:hypothetical protein